MPKENPPRSNRWEGTHTYSRTDGKRPRTAAQVREEALRRIQEDRKKRSGLSDRRRSLPANNTVRTPKADPSIGTVKEGSPTKTNQNADGNQREEGPEVEPEPTQSPGTMPGSNKKKRHASSAKPDEDHTGPPGADGIDPGLKAFLLSIKEDINSSTNLAVDRIDKRIDEHAKSIAELKQAVNDVDKKLDEKISSKVKEEMSRITPPAITGVGGAKPDQHTMSRRQQAYNFCRRTLKIWPISGDDRLDEVKLFLSNKLKFDQPTIESLGEIKIGTAPGRASREKKEVLVTFVSKEERDFVKASGIQLAGQNECGMAIHVPGHLMDNLIALNGLGYNMKTKNEGVKRAIKFDDQAEDIYMDIFIGGNWKKITPTKAKQVSKHVPIASRSTMSIEDLEELVKDNEKKQTTVVILDDMDE